MFLADIGDAAYSVVEYRHPISHVVHLDAG